jgi:hypothetical protein
LTEKERHKIYVVGYPKSGNTWLVRLLADILRAPVLSGVFRDSIEVAADINKELSLTESDYAICKVHCLPELFFEEVDDDPKTIVYIYRDVRDVIVSSYFYFGGHNKADNETLKAYVRGRCSKEMGNKVYGKWAQHYTEWCKIAYQRQDISFVWISYEELYAHTVQTLSYLLAYLDLPEKLENEIRATVERQSFDVRKKYYIQSKGDVGVYDKAYYLRFLRKGTPGDWKNYLTPDMLDIIMGSYGALLTELGYAK